MPRPNAPPTPGSSSDIRGKEGAQAAPAFNLPPTAFQEPDRNSTSSATPSANGSDSSYRPASPRSPADLARKRPATQGGSIITKDDFTLPPPPTRSRKIIQMKPQGNEVTQQQQPTLSTSTAASRTQSAPQTGGRKKTGSANSTAAGRKIARKTAHSLIERRRRSKMNEEFGVLKDMIPACKGQEMHKLAILQASIDYLRYLEQCVASMQTQGEPAHSQAPPTSNRGRDEEEEDEDEDMDDENEPETSTPVTRPLDHSNSNVSLPSLSQITSAAIESPSVFSVGAGRHYSVSSTSQASYSPYFHSNQASPAFGPQLSQVSTMPTSAGGFRDAFGLGSPALKPLDTTQSLRRVVDGNGELTEKNRPNSARAPSDRELDQEATAALLMLNTDRRALYANGREGSNNRNGNGMSVRDLLSG